MPRPFSLKNRAYVVEVVDENARLWNACALDTEGIIKELRSAPVAATITIYEWELVRAANPQEEAFSRCPYWRHLKTYPWVMREDQLDGD